jgi:hypothetical protein
MIFADLKLKIVSENGTAVCSTTTLIASHVHHPHSFHQSKVGITKLAQTGRFL